ncbi:hypothetical protein H7F51_12670 [Novosphingobium flavum]|uniref:Uncharacterized protein n=1 Tax=Novosphingobium flavum TaxID=1778672 RepID=A0A7X1KMJ5_9SPHN|nr:hypothetical protein [Novosphingobium flavum]MBC2666375.1 hypothetical protein [Novosphingobium flavum]
MKTTFDMMRVWAVLTGLVLAAWFFGTLWLGMKTSDTVPMLISAIGGFEMMLYVQDLVLKRKRQNG